MVSTEQHDKTQSQKLIIIPTIQAKFHSHLSVIESISNTTEIKLQKL